MNNAVYGKTMENVRSGINTKLARNKKYYLQWTFKPSWTSGHSSGHSSHSSHSSQVDIQAIVTQNI